MELYNTTPYLEKMANLANIPHHVELGEFMKVYEARPLATAVIVGFISEYVKSRRGHVEISSSRIDEYLNLENLSALVQAFGDVPAETVEGMWDQVVARLNVADALAERDKAAVRAAKDAKKAMEAGA
jgi:hypothetical protein